MRTSLVCLALICVMPMLALAGNWTVNPYTQTLIISINMLSTDVGFIVGGQNGQGPNILLTTDAGGEWFNMNVAQTAVPALFYFATAAQSQTEAIVGGVSFLDGSLQYTVPDGQSFTNASEPVLVDTTMSCYTIGDVDGAYACAGGYKVANEVNAAALALSYDGGKTYTFNNFLSAVNSRYGAFPSADTWFVTFGQFPNNNSSDSQGPPPDHDEIQSHHNIHISASKGIRVTRPGKHQHKSHHNKHHQRSLLQSGNGYNGTIMRTQDGGSTWTTVLSSDFSYFNQMGCADETTCYAISAGPLDSYLYQTTDGGDSFNLIQTFENQAMMALDVISATEFWVGGGSTVQDLGVAMHSTDSGNTYTNYNLPGGLVQVMDFSFLDGENGYAVGIDQEQQSNILQFA